MHRRISIVVWIVWGDLRASPWESAGWFLRGAKPMKFWFQAGAFRLLFFPFVYNSLLPYRCHQKNFHLGYPSATYPEVPNHSYMHVCVREMSLSSLIPIPLSILRVWALAPPGLLYDRCRTSWPQSKFWTSDHDFLHLHWPHPLSNASHAVCHCRSLLWVMFLPLTTGLSSILIFVRVYKDEPLRAVLVLPDLL